MAERISVVTGATGHIGYALLLKLIESNEKVRILIRKDSSIFDGIDAEKYYGDVTDPESLEKAFEGADVVYHLAGMIDVTSGHEEQIWKINVEGTKNVVKACRKTGVKRLVYASSVDAIPPLPGNELMSEISEFNPDNLEGTYAKTKAVATQYVLDNNSEALETVVTHPGACIGPYDFKTSNIGEMVRMYMNGMFPVSLSFGAYNFVDVRDVAAGMYAAADKGRAGESYILTGQVVTVDELLHILGRKTGIPTSRIKLSYGFSKIIAPGAELYYGIANKTPLFTPYSIRKLVSNCNFSIEKARRELGYDPMSVEQSISDMVDWIIEFDNEHAGKKFRNASAEKTR